MEAMQYKPERRTLRVQLSPENGRFRNRSSIHVEIRDSGKGLYVNASTQIQ